MLLLSLVLIAIGGTLMYAGVSSSDMWKQPWSPFINLFNSSVSS